MIVVGPKRIVFVENLIVGIRQRDQGFVSNCESGTPVTLQKPNKFDIKKQFVKGAERLLILINRGVLIQVVNQNYQ